MDDGDIPETKFIKNKTFNGEKKKSKTSDVNPSSSFSERLTQCYPNVHIFTMFSLKADPNIILWSERNKTLVLSPRI